MYSVILQANMVERYPALRQLATRRLDVARGNELQQQNITDAVEVLSHSYALQKIGGLVFDIVFNFTEQSHFIKYLKLLDDPSKTDYLHLAEHALQAWERGETLSEGEEYDLEQTGIKKDILLRNALVQRLKPVVNDFEEHRELRDKMRILYGKGFGLRDLSAFGLKTLYTFEEVKNGPNAHLPLRLGGYYGYFGCIGYVLGAAVDGHEHTGMVALEAFLPEVKIPRVGDYVVYEKNMGWDEWNFRHVSVITEINQGVDGKTHIKAEGMGDLDSDVYEHPLDILPVDFDRWRFLRDPSGLPVIPARRPERKIA